MLEQSRGGAQLASVLTPDSEQTLAGLPAGANVSITVTARNDAGESSPRSTWPAHRRDHSGRAVR